MTPRPDREFLRAQAAAQRKNWPEAARYLQQSVGQHGNKAAAANLAELYYIGQGVRQSYAESLNYYFKAVQSGPGFPLQDPAQGIMMMANLTECIQVQGATPNPDCLDWLNKVARGAHEDLGFVALAALCLGLMEYDKGTATETRQAAARYYRKAARLGETGSAQGNKAVQDAAYNLSKLSMTDGERLVENFASRLGFQEPHADNDIRTHQNVPAGTAAVPLPKCGRCQREDAAIKNKCSRCKKVYYCDRDCQAADWRVHKRTCRAEE